MTIKNKKVLFAVPIVLLLGWYIKTKYFSTSATTTTTQTAQAERGTLVISVTSAGQVSSTNSRTATTNVSGVVKNVFVQNGQTVKSGDKLVEVDLDQEAKQTYTQAVAAHQSAQNTLSSAQASMYSLQASMFGKWDTFKELAESDSYKDTTSPNRALPEFNIPEKEWLAAEAQYKNQQSVVSQARTALSSASQSLRLSSPVIYAPISGKVSGLSLMKGTVISGGTSSSEASTGQTVASIITDAKPTVTINLTEIDVTKVKLGDKATITIDALPNKTYTGKVISVDTVGAVSSGVTSYPAVIAFDTEAPEVFSNMSAQASIITDTKDNIVIVPSSAVKTQNGQAILQVLRNGQTEQVTVETGISSGTQTEVISGINEGDIIITSTTQTTTTNAQTTSPFSGLGGPGGFGGGTRNTVRTR